MTKEHIELEELTAGCVDYTGFAFPTLAELTGEVPLRPPRPLASNAPAGASTSNCDESCAEMPDEPRIDSPTGLPPDVNILDILNRDCLSHILAYIPIRDLIRSERVSKTWQSMVREYLEGVIFIVPCIHSESIVVISRGQ